MGSDDKRDALRVPCEFPIRVYGQMREVVGRMVNLSRTGIRIRVPLSRLMITETLDYVSLAHAVEQMLGFSFMADLHHEMLGQLIRKRLSTIRVGTVDVDADELEIGCSFEEPLGEDEIVMLGIGLPPVGVVSPSEFRNLPQPKRVGAPEAEQPAQPRPLDYDGILHATAGEPVEPIVGRTEGVVGDEVLLAISVSRLPGPPDADPAARLEAVRSAYGSSPRLEILEGVHMVWAGPVRIRELELPADDQTESALLLLATD